MSHKKFTDNIVKNVMVTIKAICLAIVISLVGDLFPSYSTFIFALIFFVMLSFHKYRIDKVDKGSQYLEYFSNNIDLKCQVSEVYAVLQVLEHNQIASANSYLTTILNNTEYFNQMTESDALSMLSAFLVCKNLNSINRRLAVNLADKITSELNKQFG